MTWLQNYDPLAQRRVVHCGFFHSRTESPVEILVSLQAYAFPFTKIVVK
jgi:hypothetical protein